MGHRLQKTPQSYSGIKGIANLLSNFFWWPNRFPGVRVLTPMCHQPSKHVGKARRFWGPDP